MHADDAFKSLGKLAEHFGGSLRDYKVDWFNTSYSSADFDMPEDLEPGEIKARLDALGTSSSVQYPLQVGFRIAYIRDGECDLDKLMQAAFQTWLKAGQADCKYLYSDETFAEHSDANEYEYYESGELA